MEAIANVYDAGRYSPFSQRQGGRRLAPKQDHQMELRSKKRKCAPSSTPLAFTVFNDDDAVAKDHQKAIKKKKKQPRAVKARSYEVESYPQVNKENYGQLEENMFDSAPSSSAGASHSSLLMTKKTIELSQMERSMKGAPEGEIFDSTVLEDTDLTPSTFPEDDLQHLLHSHALSSSRWADQFAAIEGFRKLALHHPYLLDRDPCTMGYVVDASVAAARSIRSSTARNGILCLRTLLLSCAPSSAAVFAADMFLALLHRVGNGPRFITQLAEEVVVAAAARLPVDDVLGAVTIATAHKNADTSGTAFLVAARCCASGRAWMHPEVWGRALPMLCTALDCRRGEGRKAARTCLTRACLALGHAPFRDSLQAAGVADSMADRVMALTERLAAPTGGEATAPTTAGPAAVRGGHGTPRSGRGPSRVSLSASIRAAKRAAAACTTPSSSSSSGACVLPIACVSGGAPTARAGDEGSVHAL